MALGSIILLAALSVGWGEISVQPSRGDHTHLAWQKSVAALDRPSPRTIETLKRYDLEKRFHRDPSSAITILERTVRQDLDGELVFALAELSWIEGKRLDRRKRDAAIDCFLDCVAYSFDYLFEPELESSRNPSDPRYRVAFDLYNAGLDRLIRAAQSQGKIEPGGTIKLKIHGKEMNLRVNLQDSPWKAEDVDELLMASDYEVSGLETAAHQYGLGVPLIAVRNAEKNQTTAASFLPPVTAFALTAFLRPDSRLRDSPVDVDGARVCTLDLVDPLRFRTVGKPPSAIRLESDLTTPLAYMWSRTDLNRYRWSGLLRPAAAAERSGLMLLRPYEPGKIPVVMVHGLASSPLAWIPMLNDLLRDPKIQQHSQSLLYLYPTGVPIPIAAAGLRDSLRNAEHTFNSDGRDPAFNRMVLLGHSMGGVLSHAMVVKSGNHLWQLSSDRPFQEIFGPQEDLEEMKRYVFFEPLPFIRRVVFLAAPHRGAEVSRSVVARVGSGLIDEPDHFTQLVNRLLKDNPDAFDRRRFRRMPTSIKTLEPDSPLLTALLEMEPAAGVALHSIIGALRPGPVASTTDGIVSYQSAHLAGVESERVVRSDHGVQKDPEAIIEVHRILLMHLAEGGVVAERAPQTERK